MTIEDELIYKTLDRAEMLATKEEFKQVGVASYGMYASEIGPVHAEKMRQRILEDETWDNLLDVATGFVCMMDEKIVGMAFFMPSGNPWRFFGPEWSYIRMVGVLPGMNGKGIGKKLTAFCVEEARKQGEKIIALHTSDFMKPARHVYENLGFTFTKEVEPAWDRKLLIYTLELT